MLHLMPLLMHSKCWAPVRLGGVGGTAQMKEGKISTLTIRLSTKLHHLSQTTNVDDDSNDSAEFSAMVPTVGVVLAVL